MKNSRQDPPFAGMLVINKEAGFTSQDVVAKLRGILHMKKIGHTGTLDPDAVGVLPVCLGNATKLVELIADRDKEYEALMRLGVTTDTQDMSGKILTRLDDNEVRGKVLPEDIRRAASKFTGEIWQTPPMYSAVRVNGQRLYELARQGKTIERQKRRITVYTIDITEIDLPLVTMRVRCSKGTYIRTLCEDIGNELNVGGAMEHLTRTRVGDFKLGDALTLDEVKALTDADPSGKSLQKHIIPVEHFFSSDPAIQVLPVAQNKLRNGNALYPDEVLKADGSGAGNEESPGVYRVYDEQGVFTAVYCFDDESGMFVPRRMFL